jgi:hypothetical protein
MKFSPYSLNELIHGLSVKHRNTPKSTQSVKDCTAKKMTQRNEEEKRGLCRQREQLRPGCRMSYI